jgi:FkbM family methyltransferase
MKFSVIIPTYKHFEDLLKPCINSIIQNTILNENIEIIIVANGCGNDGTKQFINSLGSPFKLLEFDDPIGFTKATNEGIKASKGDYIVLLNNDCILLDWQRKNQWIDDLYAPFINDKKIGIVGSSRAKNEKINKYFILFYCAMIDKKMFELFGLLDEVFSPGAGEDTAFCIKIEKGGYKTYKLYDDSIHWTYTTKFPIYHIAEGTMHAKDNIYNKYWNKIFERNDIILQDMFNSNRSHTNNINVIINAKSIYGLRNIIDMIDNQQADEAYGLNVIVCTDGYNEEIENAVLEHSNKNIQSLNFYKYLFLAKSEGLIGGGARAYAIDYIRNDGYVCFLDDDCLIYSNYISELYKPMHDNDISCCRIIHRSINRTIPGSNSIEYGQIDSMNFMVRNNIAKLHKNEWIYNQTYPVSNDFNFIKKCSTCANVAFVNEVLGEKYYIQDFDNIKNIEGWMTYGELHILQKYAKDKNCLEIGSFKGRSSRAIAVVAKSLICIDTFSNNALGDEHANKKSTYEDFINNTKDIDNITIIKEKSQLAHRSIPNNSIDFIFIDGDHSYNGVTSDIKNYLPKLKYNGVIAFHDYYKNKLAWVEVERAVYDMFAKNTDSFDLIDSIACFMKKDIINDTVGIIMPIFNSENTIIDTINSVIQQTYKNWKLYIVDNASKDNSYNICKEISKTDNRIHLIKNDYNSFCSGGRNIALSAALSDNVKYIATLDSDDIWYNNYLEQNIKLMNEQDADCIYSDCEYRHIDTDEKMIPHDIPYYDEFDSENLYNGNFIYVSFMFCKREVYETAGFFDEKIKVFEDWDYWCKAALVNKFKFFHNQNILGIYKVSNKTQYENLPEMLTIIKNRYNSLKNIDIKKIYDKYIDIAHQDKFLYNEIFEKNVYFVNSKLMNDKDVLDIGCNIGFFTILAKELGAKHIVAVEPNINSINQFKINTKKYSDSITLINSAVFRSGEYFIVEPNKKLGCAYISSSVKTDNKVSETKTIKELLKYFDKNNNNIILKIDTEGSEYDILYTSSIDDIRRFSTILIELHEDLGIDILYDKNIQNINTMVSYIKFLGYKFINKNTDINYLIDGRNVKSHSFRFDRINQKTK